MLTNCIEALCIISLADNVVNSDRQFRNGHSKRKLQMKNLKTLLNLLRYVEYIQYYSSKNENCFIYICFIDHKIIKYLLIFGTSDNYDISRNF